MDENIKNHCLIFIKDGMNLSNETQHKSKYLRKSLIIDITKQKEEFYRMSKNTFYRLVEKYIHDNNFKGIKSISFSDLKCDNNILQSKKSILLKKIITDENILNKIEYLEKAHIIPILGLAILYFFYQLGYAFLYGYYFGGNYDTNISFFDMFVNPVPFNFKSIVCIGVLLLIYLNIYFIPFTLIVRTKKKKAKIIYIFLQLISVLLISITCKMIFIGTVENDMFNNMMLLLVGLLMVPIYSGLLVYYAKAFYENTLEAISGMLYTIIIFSNLEKSFSNKSLLCVFVYFSGLLGAIVFSKIKNLINKRKCVVIFLKKFIYIKYREQSKFVRFIYIKIKANYMIINTIFKIIYDLIIFFPIGSLCFIFISSIFKFNKDKKYLIICSLIFIVGIIIKNIYIIKRASKITYDNSNIKDDKQINDKGNKKDKGVVIVIGLLMCLGYVVVSMPCLTQLTGRIIRQSITGLSKDKIVYKSVGENQNVNTLFGNVVAQGENIYFISKYPERKLVSIKTLDIYTFPCDDFYIIHTPSKIYNIKNKVNNKYSSLLNNKQITVGKWENYKSNLKFKDEWKIYLNKNSTTEKHIKIDDCFVKLNIEYILDEGKKPTKFVLQTSIKSLYNEVTSQNQILRQQMENLIIEYKDELIKYFNLPKLNNNNCEFFYSDCKLVYTKKEENGECVESYSLVPLH